MHGFCQSKLTTWWSYRTTLFGCCNLSKCCRSVHFFQWNESEHVVLPIIIISHSVCWISGALNEHYSHFSLVRTLWGKEKILYSRELLVSEKFFKTRWIPLVLPSPVILGEKIFLLSRITCYYYYWRYVLKGLPSSFDANVKAFLCLKNKIK